MKYLLLFSVLLYSQMLWAGPNFLGTFPEDKLFLKNTHTKLTSELNKIEKSLRLSPTPSYIIKLIPVISANKSGKEIEIISPSLLVKLQKEEQKEYLKCCATSSYSSLPAYMSYRYSKALLEQLHTQNNKIPEWLIEGSALYYSHFLSAKENASAKKAISQIKTLNLCSSSLRNDDEASRYIAAAALGYYEKKSSGTIRAMIIHASRNPPELGFNSVISSLNLPCELSKKDLLSIIQ